MKNWILLTGLCLCIASCDNGFEDLNTNPDQPSQVAYGAMFNQLVSSLRLGWDQQLFLNNEVLYDVTELGVVTARTFGNVSGGSEDVWNNYYSNLALAKELKHRLDTELLDVETGHLMRAQTNILMAYKTALVTDLFGDIPYTEAGNAFSEDPIIRPKYDTQESIYKSIITDLENAIITLSAGGQTSSGNAFLRFGNSESLFNDNISRWIRFGNSLQLRYLVRIHDKDPDYAAPRVKELIESGADIVTKGNDVVMSPRSQQWQNLGLNWSFREHNKLRLGSTMWNFMTDDDGEIIDPRARLFFEENNNEEWVAFPQISDASTQQSGGEPYNQDRRDGNHADKGADNIYSSFNFYLVRDEDDIPEVLMSSAEVQFLRAEIFIKGIGVTADPFLADFAYQNGVLESLEFWQKQMADSEVWVNKPEIISTGDLFNVILNPKYFFDINADLASNLEKIYAQRWIDAFRQPWEAFNLLRRTNNTPREKAANTFNRFMYPPSESSFNSEHYNTQVGSMGGDINEVKIWWME